MADRSIKVILRAEIGDFKAKMTEAAKATESFGKGAGDWVSKNSTSISTLSTQIGLIGAGLTALGGLAVKKFADFDQAMSNVAATGEDARGSLDALREAAISAGQATAYSATEAAGAIENLAKAGVSAKDILGGALAGSLDLAAAGGLEVADAAEIASIAMTQFSLSGADVGHVADLLAAGAGKANGSVADLGMALKQSGLVAAQTGLSIEETTASLAAFAAAGLLGSDAGTSLKTMLQRLTNPSKEAATEMERLGISAYDAAGNFVGMEALAGQLKAGLDELTPAQRNAALSIIFGADAVRAASVLYSEGAEGIASWTAKVNDSGYAAEVAAIRMDNLKGDLEQLGGSIETALIGMGSAADGPLRSLVQTITNVVNAFAQLPPAVQGGLGILVGGSGLILLGVAAVGKFAVAVVEAKTALVAMGIVSEATGNKVAGFAAKAGLAVGKVALIVGALELLNGATTQAGIGLNEMQTKLDGLSRSSDVVKTIFGDFVPENQIARGKDFLEQVVEPLANPSTWGSIGNHLEDLGISIERVFGGQAVKWSEITQRMADVDSALASMASSSLPDAVEGFQALYDEVGGTEEAGIALLGALPGLRDALIGIASDAGLATDDATLLAIALGDVAPAADGMAGALGEQAGAAEATADAIERLIEAYDEMNGKSLNLLDATSAWEEALDGVSAALEKNGKTTDLTTEAGRANVQVLTDMARKASDLAQATYDSTGSTDQFYASLQVSRQALADTAVAMGMSAEQAWAFVDSVLAIPPAPAVTPTVDTTEADGQLETLIFNIDSASGTITVNGNPVPAETTLGDLIGNVDAATGTVTIGGNRFPADTTLADFLALTNTSSGTVTVNAATAAAEAAINWTARDRVSTITVRTYTTSAGPAGSTGNLYAGYTKNGNQGGLITPWGVRGFAGGGLVPGTPPADPRADNVLATGPGGLFALRSGEYVSTQESTTRNRAALAAGNRGATLVVAGMAGGGAVGYARAGGASMAGDVGREVARALSGARFDIDADRLTGNLVARIRLQNDRRAGVR